MTITPIALRDWCCLSTCVRGTIPQDCVLIGSFAVCKSCLIDLGEGVDPEDLAEAEEELRLANTRIDLREEELEKLKAQTRLEQKEVSSD